MELFDSHAHYNDEKFEQDKETVLQQVFENGITKLVCAGYSLQSSKQAVKIAQEHDFVYAIVGISPNDIPEVASKEPIDERKEKFDKKDNSKIEEESKELEVIQKIESTGTNKIAISKFQFEREEKANNAKLEQLTEFLEPFKKQLEEELQEIEKLAEQEKVVAIGEIGLDYYWNKENKEEQKIAFIKQIELANKLNLPIVIHTREAVYDTLNILKNQIDVRKKGIFHCCPLNPELIKEGLKLGFYISFAGPITFKNSKNAEEVIKLVPLDKILIETDSPYLAPEPKRGTRNDSSNVKYMAEKIAQVKGITVQEVAKVTYENAMRIFEIE